MFGKENIWYTSSNSAHMPTQGLLYHVYSPNMTKLSKTWISTFLVHVFVQIHAHITLFGKNTNHVMSGHCCRILRLPRARNQERDYRGKVTLTSPRLFTLIFS